MGEIFRRKCFEECNYNRISGIREKIGYSAIFEGPFFAVRKPIPSFEKNTLKSYPDENGTYNCIYLAIFEVRSDNYCVLVKKNANPYFLARSITLTACANDESNNRIQPNCPKNNEEILIINATYGRMVNNEYCGGGGGGGGVTNCRSPVGKVPYVHFCTYVSKHSFAE